MICQSCVHNLFLLLQVDFYVFAGFGSRKNNKSFKCSCPAELHISYYFYYIYYNYLLLHIGLNVLGILCYYGKILLWVKYFVMSTYAFDGWSHPPMTY